MKILSIDIGGTFLKYALMEHEAKFIERGKVKTPSTLESFLTTISTILNQFSKEIIGVSISCPGKIDSNKGLVYFGGALPYLHKFKLKEFIETNYQVKCVVVNDGKSAAIAEMKFGNLRNERNAVAIILGTGIGGGIILNKELLIGGNYQAGEFSFVMNNCRNPSFNDLVGKTGSAVEFIRSANNVLNLSENSSGKVVFDEIKKGTNQDLNNLFITYTKEIALFISNLQVILDIDKVVIGGGISRQPMLIAEIKKQYKLVRNAVSILDASFQPLKIDSCFFHNDANLIGAFQELQGVLKND